MRKKLTHNLGLKIASLLLACVIWFMVAQIGDPKDRKTYDNVPVTFVNTELLDAENKVYSVLNDTDIVSVEVYAPKSILNNLRSSDIIAEADMGKLTDINTIAIRFRIPNVEVDSIYGNHEVVQLAVEEKKTKWIRVEHGTVGEVADGYIIYGETVDQTLIEISGPNSLISQVSYAKAELDVTGASTNMSANVVVDLYDRDDQLIDQKNIKKNTDLIHMYVDILATKEVPVKVQISGSPANGYALTGENYSSVSKITVAGTKYQLNSINAIEISGVVLDVSDMTQTLSKTVDIVDFLPEGIRVADSRAKTTATVTAVIEPIQEMTVSLSPANITINGTVPDKEIQKDVTVDSYEFIFRGLQKDLDAFKEEGVKAVVDIEKYMQDAGESELKPGVYDIPITVNTPNQITCAKELTMKITVKDANAEH